VASATIRGKRGRANMPPSGRGPVPHMNFHLCHGAVIVPVAGDRRLDDAPLEILRVAFPWRNVVRVQGNRIAAGGGGFQ
jgi:agmatine/peptidylarginine deiminase